MERNKTHYNYVFSNGFRQVMTPIEAHKYADKLKIEILQGPGYIAGKREKSFDGWGWHDSLRMMFRGPANYRQYLRENGLVEAGVNDKPVERVIKKPLWDEELIRKCNTQYGMDIGGVLAEALLSGELDFPDGSNSEDFNGTEL